MEELCLVLDEFGLERLVLEKGENFKIDEYTSKNFENSRQIRAKYKHQIDEYLNKNKYNMALKYDINYKGRIVIVTQADGNNIMKKVLYKKHIVAFNEIIKDKEIMIKFSLYQRGKKNKSLVPDQFHYMIRSPWNKKNSVKTYINNWIKEEKQKQLDYYEIIRDMMIVYEKERNKYYLPSIDEIYDLYEKEKEQRIISKIQQKGSLKLQQNTMHTIVSNSIETTEEKMYCVNGNKYTIDELHLLDLEDIDSDSEYIPDVMSENIKRI
jgi:hypothetical protein